MDKSALPIAVMDSGVGGVSVLRELVRLLPEEDFLYFGDVAHAPYGNKSAEEVRVLMRGHVEQLRRRGVKALVVACNTATATAVDWLRLAHKDLPILSVEPALKPAVLAHPGQRVVVMATPTTLKEERFGKLLQQYQDQADIALLPCPGLSDMVERGVTSGPELEELLGRLIAPFRQPQAAGVVLGCTHYPFVAQAIIRCFGYEPEIFDGSLGTARETKRRLAAEGLLGQSKASGKVEFLSSSQDPAFTRLAQRLLVEKA